MYIFEQKYSKKYSIADPSMMTLEYNFEAKSVLFISFSRCIPLFRDILIPYKFNSILNLN